MQQQQHHSVYSNTGRSQQNWLMFPFLKWFPSTAPQSLLYHPRAVFSQPPGASNLCNCRKFWPPGAQICATVVNYGPRGLRSAQLSSIMALRILPGGSLPGEPPGSPPGASREPPGSLPGASREPPGSLPGASREPPGSLNHHSSINQASNKHQSTISQPSINHQPTINQPSINCQITTYQPSTNHQSTAKDGGRRQRRSLKI